MVYDLTAIDSASRVIGVRTLRQMDGCLFPPARRHLRIKAASGVMAFAVALIATREGA